MLNLFSTQHWRMRRHRPACHLFGVAIGWDDVGSTIALVLFFGAVTVGLPAALPHGLARAPAATAEAR